MDVKHIIGFDLGHGQTAIASVATHDRARLEILEINNKKVQTTALKRSNSDPKVAVAIGDRVFNKIVEPRDELHIAFKARPHDDPTYRRNMQEFYCSILRQLKETRQVPKWDDRIIILGCPSEWSNEERQAYQELFNNPEFPEIKVVSESRAALLHVMEQQGTTLSKTDLDDGAVLVIDVGSSTTDFSIIHGWNSEEPLHDFGKDLGASYFDEEILKYSVEQNKDADRLNALIEANDNLVPMMKYLCRQAKQKYFDSPDDFAEDYVSVDYRDIKDVIFKPRVNGVLMNQLIDQKLTNSQYSWVQTFNNLLQQAKNEIAARGFSLKAILLTGGASRMGFIRESIKDVFLRDKPELKFQQDSEPEYSVASGLARWGRRRYLIESFLKKVKEVFEGEMPQLIDNHISPFLDILIPKLVDKVITDFAIPALLDWKKGNYKTIENLQENIKQQLDDWLETPEGIQLIASIGNEWWDNKVGQEFLFVVNPLCTEHDVPIGQMSLKIPFRSESFFKLDFFDPLQPLIKGIGYIIIWMIVWILPLGGPIIAAGVTIGITKVFKDQIDNFIDKNIKFENIKFIDEKINKFNFPEFARAIVDDAKIYSLGEKRDELVSKARQAIDSNDVARKSITSQLIKHLRTEVEEKAHEASRFIQ
jgi:hypothetical protein